MCRRLLTVAIACVISAPVGPRAETAFGQQISFDPKQEGDQTVLNYVFRPHSRERIAFGFTMPTASLNKAVAAFQRIEPHDMRRRFRAERKRLLDREVANLRARYPKAKIRRKDNGVEWSISANKFNNELRKSRDALLKRELDALRRQFRRSKITRKANGKIEVRGPKSEIRQLDRALAKALDRVEAYQKRRSTSFKKRTKTQMRALRKELKAAVASMDKRLEAFELDYYANRAYTLTGNTIKPDYVTIARNSAPRLRPLADAWRRITDEMPSLGVINRLLGFFQTIPYDELTSRLTSNGSGFAFPLALLARNRGDCDTKSVAFAAVLHLLYPKMPIVMVLVPGHALIGLGIPSRPGDRTLNADGRTYVLAEPVGPHLGAVGEIGEDTRGKLALAEILPLF